MPRRPRLLWQIYLWNLLVLVPALFLVTLLGYRETREQYLQGIRAGLALRAELLARLLEDDAPLERPSRLQALFARLAGDAATRYTIIAPDGRVLADSARDPEGMEDHAGRPEVRAALEGRSGEDTRVSRTLGLERMYRSAPVFSAGRVVAVVRTSVGLEQISSTLLRQIRRIGLAGLLVALLAALVNLLVASRLVRPLRDLQEGAERFAAGDLRYRLEVPASEEPGALAESMNEMAAQLGERLRQVTRQARQQEAVLSSMVEAVLVVDERGRLVQLNEAAVRLFDLDPDSARGASLELAIPHRDLQRFFLGLLDGPSPQESELTLESGQLRHLRAVGTRMRDASGQRLGAMVVLHDVTQVKRLEALRRDFVANVSHELRTPITSIQGFVETLRDGALEEPEDARRFLEIIARHAERLSAITSDLLSLSRIEIEGGAGQIPLAPAALGPVLAEAIQLCEGKAAERRVHLTMDVEPDLEAPINPPLLEQAVVNLVDNAIKYTAEGGHVAVSARREDREVVITVSDDGCGIAPEHQPRIFERFYRVDRARSRALGGTGLGLAIVKHITAAHYGLVSVESSLGQGATFKIRIPAEAERGRTTSGEKP